ncbi:hypothetical protein BDZ94DRAFT_1262981 [Collybia nuda]|uniref:Uncharacterized protein n=1 Tax=Collybia nuda TaxID=64659 RepID=A0A9P6CDG8_9AGAR|nr:hypothetical protein BDZ94DRAFT_1262981 [Collybia nuda]
MIPKFIFTSVSVVYASFLALLVLPSAIATEVNFTACFAQIRNGDHGNIGGTDNQGHHISNIGEATAVIYELCVTACGAGPEPFDWSVFSQQFSSWLLPWLALVSQLPFGANDKFDNLESMLLTVGSPVLAAYSLALTLLNGRWITRLFSPHTHIPKAMNALHVLNSLQQSPLIINTDDSLLISLVFLDENEPWWAELDAWLDYTHTWSIAAVTSISWVVIAYLFTLIDSFHDITISINANGQGVGLIWLWLLPIVLGWLQISPKCDSARLYRAVNRANKVAYVKTPSGAAVLASSISRQRAISLAVASLDQPVRRDELCTAPIYNYARFFPWVQAVEEVERVFRLADKQTRIPLSDDSEVGWEDQEKTAGDLRIRRMYTPSQVEARHLALKRTVLRKQNHRDQDVWSRIFLASILALSLQWGTTGAAIVAVWFTPTSGLGCRSGSYILYGGLSTVIWMMLVLSSILSRYSTATTKSTFLTRTAAQLSIFLRRCGKVLAVFNTILVIASGIFQFSKFYDRCYCNSSVLGWGYKAFFVMQFNQEDMDQVERAWIGGVALAAGTAALFAGFITLFLNPSPPSNPRSS